MFKTLATKYITKHPYFTSREDAYQTPLGKIVDPYFVVEMPSSACAMAITADHQMIFAEQYRHPIGQTILELPGGFIEPGEDEKSGIARELLEETGYAFSNIHHLGITAANPGVLNNFTHLFIATGGQKMQEQSLDKNEEISLVLKSLHEAHELLLQNKIVQSMHALCMFYGFHYLASYKS
ncbi:MAG: hypothetical protein ABS68_12390 [Niastella sp. SCN 39-18]|nr:NUDIX hydrolase [Sphingobacteriales bacterium]ODT51595.1 MAG: hypothetical protein ABS68_12390 [Niastella sp. SCN 39-18]OJW08266.1 MAG: hypothetical protein BGO53_05380 [Sphingobacteriales bacterium 39-19]